MRTMTDDQIDRLGHAIAADGMAGHHDAVCDVARLATAAGAPESLVGILTDPTAAEVARARALSHAVAAIRRCRTNPDVALVA
jgi:hypothetical protein